MKKTELHYVAAGEVIEFTYTFGVLIEARFRNCPVLAVVALELGALGDTAHFNSIVDWLIKNHQDEFKLRKGE